jgi:hypothetical protein
MTLLAVWIRKVKKVRHLIVASDSRLSGGMRWDCCPKIFPLDRGDSALCFAGDTYHAYPIILQVCRMINMHDKVMSRALDIYDLQSCISNIANSMLEYRHSFPTSGEIIPKVIFLFAGYSWKFSKFAVWKHYYCEEDRKFKRTIVVLEHKRRFWPFFFEGNNTAKRNAKNKLLKHYNKIRELGENRHCDMEPFDILTEFINDEDFDDIGGPPQLVKMYPHMNCLPFNIYWPSKQSGNITFYGRSLLKYEKNKYLVLDPETKDVTIPEFPNVAEMHE